MTRSRITQILFWLSMLSLAAAAVIYVADLTFSPELWVGVGVLLLGLNVLLGGGDIVVGGQPRLFTARGQVVRGVSTVQAGLCDLVVGDCPGDRLAMMRYGPMGKPQFEEKDGIAYMTLMQPTIPNISDWKAGLAKNVLWDVDVRSSLGDMTLNLSNLRLEKVSARSRLGHITLNLPQRGYVDIEVRTGIGEIEVVIPPEVEVDVTVSHGPLTTVTVNNERLEPDGPNRYATSSDPSITLHVRVGVGDIRLN